MPYMTSDGMVRPELWPSAGFRLLARDPLGRLQVTDDFLGAYLSRPELAPAEESCNAERALHARLLEDPTLAVGAETLAALADPDARENYGVILNYRDRLLEAGTIEACYLAQFQGGDVTLPGLFIDQMFSNPG